MKALAKKYPLSYTIAAFFLGIVLMEMLQRLIVLRGTVTPANADIFLMGVVRLITAAVVAWFVWNISGKKSFGHKKGAFGFALKTCLISIVPFVILAALAAGAQKENRNVSELLKTFVLCVSVGLFEELLFRVLPCDGLMRALKGEKCALRVILWVPAFIFGLVHVLGSVGSVKDAASAATFVFKVIECALFGVILMLCFLRDRDLWAIAAVHMLFDLFPLLVAYFSEGGISFADGYVTGGEKSVGALVVNGAIIVAEIIILLRLRKKLIPKLDFDRLIEEW